MDGTVRKYNIEKGYGFIEANSGLSVFFHASSLKGVKIKENDRVSFEVLRTIKGAQAVNLIRKISGRTNVRQ